LRCRSSHNLTEFFVTMIEDFTSSRFTLFQSGAHLLSPVVITPRIYRSGAGNMSVSDEKHSNDIDDPIFF
jgi:hypothetical protein